MDRDDLLFRATLSARYHRRRAAFLERFSSVMAVLTLISGTGAFLSVLGEHPNLTGGLAIVVIAISIIQIVFQTDKCANEHRHWLRDWNAMLRDIHQHQNPTSALLAEWIQRYYEIESQCVAEMRALVNDSYNRTLNELDREGDSYTLRWWQKLLMQFISFENATFR